MTIFLKDKWKLVLITLLPWTAAAFYYFSSTPPCVSEAKLLVRYVIDADFPSPEQRANLADNSDRIDQMFQLEMDLLTSRELAERAVEKVGVLRLAPRGREPADPPSLIAAGLTVTADKGSNVIRIAFRHADAETARATLKALIDSFLDEHLKIHRTAAKPGVPQESGRKSLALINSPSVFGRSAAKLEADDDRTIIQMPNVCLLQQPTPGLRDTKRRNQILLGLIACGPVLGILAVLALAPVRQWRSAGQRGVPQHIPPT